MYAMALDGSRIAVLSTGGFEQSELMLPRQALLEAGADVKVVSHKQGQIRGWQKNNWGQSVHVDATLDTTTPGEFDALMLPGGVLNADQLRTVPQAVDFVRAFFIAGKPVAAICHGPWLLVEAGVVKSRTLTSWPSLRTDIVNAGGRWVDREVHVDSGLVTSRKPADLSAFNAKMVEEFARGIDERGKLPLDSPIASEAAPAEGVVRT